MKKIKEELEKCKSLTHFGKNHLKLNKHQLELLKWFEDKIKNGYKIELVKGRNKSAFTFIKDNGR